MFHTLLYRSLYFKQHSIIFSNILMPALVFPWKMNSRLTLLVHCKMTWLLIDWHSADNFSLKEKNITKIKYLHKCEIEVPTAVTAEITVFWDVTPLNLVDCNWCFQLMCLLHLLPEDEGNMFFWSVGNNLPGYRVSYLKRHSSLFK
jgi:hypothetical protein